MTSALRILLAIWLALPLLASCAPAQQRGPVVLAAASLTDAMEEVADSWEAQGHARPVLSFAGTSSLARQVEAGAPADIFVSADSEWMDWLEDRDLVRAGSRHDLLTNDLVIVGDENHTPEGEYRESPALLIGKARFAMGDADSVPAGRYARAALERIGQWEALRDQAVPTDSVRAAVALVERGEVPYAIVYATDAKAMTKGGLAGLFPAGSLDPIVYPAAQLASSSHADAAEFLTFLRSDQAGAIFAAYGFGLAR
ncbi:molybdate ABC transporter substrate-binding protein [Alteraurantiacibacter aestuarii]|uniref:Molybdate ABC transporter substrate-binding protein n=1 Tax=Alteraurantiacibacter aestuarii TaxID=650004 RepID=A0A844ZQW2_9SPHN|nr:molybdate ABC transporter substrate-binding protein [Alteraurantiacibacter aestuarii]